MKNSIIEITDELYCIKLTKDNFHLSLLKQFISKLKDEKLLDDLSVDEDDDFKNRASWRFEENFDRLCEK